MIAWLIVSQVGLTTDLAKEPEPKVAVRLDLSQLATADSVTDRNILYTDLRATFDGEGLLTEGLELHLDGRGRYGWNDISPSRYDLTHAYLQYGNAGDRLYAGLGRITVTELANVQVDGAQVGVTLAEGARVSVFGGLMPHPITRAFNAVFANVGASFEFREKTQNHAGGVSVQLYEGALDRIMVSDRFYVRPHRDLTLAGSAVVDFLEKPDLTNAFLMVRYGPATSFDVTVTGSHIHALIPNRWWEDWVEQERQRRGFTLDGPAPVGTRRTNARVVANFHVGPVSPYVVGRFDHRHEDGKNGWEGRAGIKLAKVGLGYADVSGAYRRYFDVDNQLGTIQLGLDVVSWLGVDAGASILRTDGELLYDANGSIWVHLVDRVYTMATYQVFIEPQMQFHMVLARIGYRLKG